MPTLVQLFVTPWTTACQASLSITNSWRQLKLMSIESMMPFNHLILCCPLIPPSIFPSIRVFFNELSICIRWPKHWSFSFNISTSNEYSGLTSLRNDWLDLLIVSPRDSQVFSNTTVRKYQFFSAQPSLWSNIHICKELTYVQGITDFQTPKLNCHHDPCFWFYLKWFGGIAGSIHSFKASY